MAHVRAIRRTVRPLLPLVVLALAACGTPGTPGTPSVDLDGRITDSLGVGVPNISVAPVGRAPVVTGIDGSFTFTDVETPYDLVAFTAADAWAHLFLDLSTTEPEVVPGEAMLGGSFLEGSDATIALTPDVLVGANQVLVLCVESPDLAMASCEDVQPGDPYPVSVTAGWYGPGSVDATVRGVLYTLGADELPTDALRMGTATINVQDGDAPALGLTTAAVADVDVSVNVDVPVGSTLEGLGAIVALPDGRNALRIPFGTPIGTSGTIALPDIAGASVVIAATGSDANGAQIIVWSDPIDLTSTTVDLTLPDAPAMLQPADGAAGIGVGAVFEVQERPNEAYAFVINPSASGPFLLVSSVEGRVTLPDLTDLDNAFAIPSGQPYEWLVFAFSPVSGADALASDGGPGAAYTAATLAGGSGFGPGPEEAGWFVMTSPRGFTTP